jgi:hypothetical protein
MNVDNWVKFLKILRYNATPYWQDRIDHFMKQEGIFRQTLAEPVEIIKEKE